MIGSVIKRVLPMKKYQVLARRFRPKNFKEVVGQESVVTILKNAMRNSRVSHAYLFSGMRGVGKTTLARVLAKALNCQNPTQDLEPCNNCSSCNEIDQCHSLDVIEIDGASNRGIDDIRKINETVHYAPSSGKYKIYIIDEVHMLTKEAFNALLKTLEAPPEKVKFFFATTEIHKVLPTILSRTQRLELQSISFEKIKDHLQKIADLQERKVSEKALLLIAKHAEGSLRDSLSLFDQILCYTDNLIDDKIVEEVLGLIPSDLFIELDSAIQNNTPAAIFALVDQLVQKGKNLTNFLDQLIEHMRSNLHKALRGSSVYTEQQILYILEKLIEGQILLQKSCSKQAIIEMLLLQITESKTYLSLPQLAKRLLLLEKELSATNNKSQPPIPSEIAPDKSVNSTPIETSPIPVNPKDAIASLTKTASTDLVSAAAVPVEDANTTPVEKSLTPKLVKEDPPVSTAKPEPIPTPSPIKENSLEKHTSHYDNLMKFSEVELEGIIHKN